MSFIDNLWKIWKCPKLWLSPAAHHRCMHNYVGYIHPDCQHKHNANCKPNKLFKLSQSKSKSKSKPNSKVQFQSPSQESIFKILFWIVTKSSPTLVSTFSLMVSSWLTLGIRSLLEEFNDMRNWLHAPLFS